MASVAASPSSYASPQKGCGILSKKYPYSTFFPGTARYDFENEYGWTASSWLGPTCIFTPETPEMVSFAIKVFSQNKIKFAVLGGCAMPVDNAANIGSEGILIANTNLVVLLAQLTHQGPGFNCNKGHIVSTSCPNATYVVSVGAGVRWPALYAYLNEFNITTNGIRMGNVGVIGFLLGGGIGFFSYKHGVATTSVESFECVLSNGKIFEASLIQNENLFWALRGSGNNFCIVTRASLRTLDVSAVSAAVVFYGSGKEAQYRYIRSMLDFALCADTDPKTSVEGQIQWVPSQSNDLSFDAFLFHSADFGASPRALQNFTAPVLTPISGNLTKTTMGTWANQFPYHTDIGNRKIFHFFSIPADVRAMEICLDTYYKAVEHLAGSEGFFTAFSIMPITRHVISQSTANGGNPVGLDENSAQALWLVESPSWSNGADDADVLAAHDKANEDIKQALAAEGFEQLRFIYLSDASRSQLEDIFPSYGQENVERLQAIRGKYDPASIYTELLPGGAKVVRA